MNTLINRYLLLIIVTAICFVAVTAVVSRLFFQTTEDQDIGYLQASQLSIGYMFLDDVRISDNNRKGILYDGILNINKLKDAFCSDNVEARIVTELNGHLRLDMHGDFRTVAKHLIYLRVEYSEPYVYIEFALYRDYKAFGRRECAYKVPQRKLSY